MALFKGRAGRDDTFTGGTKADRFEFDPRDLDSGDTIVGGDGRAVDTLRFTTAGAIGVSALANVSGIERVELASGGANSLVLSNDFVASANGARVTVIGGSGDDLVFATDLYDGSAIDFVSNGGTDYVFAGEGDDTFTFDVAALDERDRVVGGKGLDTLVLSGSGVVSGQQTSGVSGLSAVMLGDGGIALTVTDGLAQGNVSGGMVVTGGAGADTIDASTVTGTALSLFGGAGDDTIRGGSFGVLVDGGAGADTILIGQGAVVYDANDIRVSTGTGTLSILGAATINAQNAADQTAGDTAVVTGFQNFDASASKQAVSITGTGFGALFGGAGRDTIAYGTFLRGGAGADTLIGSSTAGIVTFELLKGDFARGEVIRGSGDAVYDVLRVVGSADLRIGTVQGIDRLEVVAAGARTTVTMSAAQLASVGYVSGNADAAHAITVQVEFGRNDLVPTHVSSYGALLDLQFSGKNDTIGSFDGSVVIHAGGGNDTITARGTVFGEDGDDTMSGDLSSGPRHGGVGTDTLVLSGYAFTPVLIDLSARNQAVSGVSELSGFENVSLSQLQNGGVTLIGSAAANVLTGTFEADTISGGDGNDTLRGGDSYSGGRDVLDGGRGDDLLFGSSGFGGVDMTGGAGADTFRFSTRENDFGVDPMDRITDFKPGEDRLEFVGAKFGFSGTEFDTLVVANNARTDITGADLILYKGVLSSVYDVANYINSATGGDNDSGVFVAALNSVGETVLYHSPLSDYADESSISPIANLGDIGKLTNLTLADFAFI